MRSSRSKLLHELGGHSMLSYAVTAATMLQPQHVVVVVGDGAISLTVPRPSAPGSFVGP